jgi:hypothetical protein
MALSPQQLASLKVASARKAQGRASPSDLAALKWAQTQGWKPTTVAPAGGTVTGDITPAPNDPGASYLDAIKGLLARPQQPAITPFDQSGFYNEADTKTLANQEYDPWAAKQKAYQDAINSEQDRRTEQGFQDSQRNTLEQVNAAGGFRSSAYQRDTAQANQNYQNDADLRRQALQRATEDQGNQLRAQKDSFVTSRRGEAYQRYLQSIGALTQ